LAQCVVEDEYAFCYEKEIRQLERVKHCGDFYTGRSPTTGGHKVIPNSCDLYCLCDYCLNRRANLYREQIKSACADGNLYITTINQANWTNIRKEYPGEANYLCFPQGLEDITVFINNTMFINLSTSKHAKLFSPVNQYEAALTYDWAMIVKTPEGRKVSGTLGRKTEEPKISYGEVVNIQANLSRDGERVDLYEVTQINNEVMDETAELDPHTIIEIQAAMHIRDTRFIEIAKERGCKVKTRHQTLKVTLNPNSISWVNYYALTVASRAKLKEFKRLQYQSYGITEVLDI
jgi:hypothetical protein